MKNPEIAPATGKLGILLVGLGAVSTTTIAGVLAVRKGLANPIGSLTQMGTIRLGKRTEGRSPKINETVPLVNLDNIVFGGWDIFEENSYQAARTAGVLETALLDQIAKTLERNPWIKKVRIEGHTDDRGKDAYNLDLSNRRAASVRQALLDRGVSDARLESVGYGEG